MFFKLSPVKNDSYFCFTIFATGYLRFWTKLRSIFNLNILFGFVRGEELWGYGKGFPICIFIVDDSIELLHSAPMNRIHIVYSELVWEWLEVKPCSSIWGSMQVLRSSNCIAPLTSELLWAEIGFISIN